MDIFYIDTIEQVIPPENFDYNVNEYGKREQWKLPFEQVESKYFKKLSDVSADIIGGGSENAKHYYMDIKIVNSDGEIVKKDKLGKRQEVEKVEKPVEPEAEG